MIRLLLLLALSAPPALAERYSYETCARAIMFWCRHAMPVDRQLFCVAGSVRQCDQCVTYRDMRQILGEADAMGTCRAWLDGTVVRGLRRAGKDNAR